MELQKHRNWAFAIKQASRKASHIEKVTYTKKRRMKWYLLLPEKINFGMVLMRVNNEAGDVSGGLIIKGFVN